AADATVGEGVWHHRAHSGFRDPDPSPDWPRVRAPYAARMMMSGRVRQLALTAHVTASVSWLGAVAAFFALAISGLTNSHAETVRGAYLAMDITASFVIVPLCLASLVTGLVQSLGTR